MARLVKNIYTRQNGSLKAGRLLDGVLPPEKIAELIASGHAKQGDDDESLSDAGKNAENATEALELAFKRGYRHGYAAAVNDAVDTGIINAQEAGTVIFHVDFEDEVIGDGGVASDTAAGEAPENKAPEKPAKTRGGKGKKA